MEMIFYINGKRVTKEELENYEIKNEEIKRMFAKKLTEKEE